MKNVLILFAFILMFNANASIEQEGSTHQQPSDAVIAKNRACFKNLEDLGCGTMEENPVEFRACMSNAHMTLDDYCKNLMATLYGSK